MFKTASRSLQDDFIGIERIDRDRSDMIATVGKQFSPGTVWLAPQRVAIANDIIDAGARNGGVFDVARSADRRPRGAAIGAFINAIAIARGKDRVGLAPADA